MALRCEVFIFIWDVRLVQEFYFIVWTHAFPIVYTLLSQKRNFGIVPICPYDFGYFFLKI